MGKKTKMLTVQAGGNTLAGIESVSVPERIVAAVPDDFDLPAAAGESTIAAQERSFIAFAKIKGRKVDRKPDGTMGLGENDPKGPILEQAMRAAAILNGGEAKDKPQFDMGGDAELAAEFARMVGEDPEVKEKKDKTREWLKKHFWGDGALPALAREIAKGVFKYHLTRVIGSEAEAYEILKYLVAEGFLRYPEKGETAQLMFGATLYMVTPKACFGPPELAEVQAWMKGLHAKMEDRRKAERREAGDELAQKSNLSPADLLAGRPGTFYFRGIPAGQMYRQPKHDEGNEPVALVVRDRGTSEARLGPDGQPILKMCPGGSLLVKIEGREILLIDSAHEKIQQVTADAKKWDIRVPLASILENIKDETAYPPQAPELRQKLGKEEFGNYIRTFNIAWNLVRNGFRTILLKMEERKLVNDELGRLQEGCTVPAEEAVLELKPGTFALKFDWTPQRGDPIPNLIYRATVTEVAGEKFIRLDDVGANAPEEFLGGLIGQEWPVGEKFAGVKQPFLAVLHASWSCLRRRAKPKTDAK